MFESPELQKDGWYHVPENEHVYEGWFRVLHDPARIAAYPFGGRAVGIAPKNDGTYMLHNKQDQIVYGIHATLAEAKTAGDEIVARETASRPQGAQ